MPRRSCDALVTLLALALALAAVGCTPLEARDKEREKNAGGGTMLREPGPARSP